MVTSDIGSHTGRQNRQVEAVTGYALLNYII